MAELTDAAIGRALAKGREAALSEPRAASVRYDAASRRVIVELTNGCTFAFPADLAQGLEGASDTDLAAIEILGNGYGLHWPTLDTDLAIPDLMAGLLGTRSWMTRKAGKTTSKAKAKAKAIAARQNGKKGGRPRKAVSR
jgi:hypothetical protein